MKYFQMGIFVIPGVCLIRKYGSQTTAFYSAFQCFSGCRGQEAWAKSWLTSNRDHGKLASSGATAEGEVKKKEEKKQKVPRKCMQQLNDLKRRFFHSFKTLFLPFFRGTRYFCVKWHIKIPKRSMDRTFGQKDRIWKLWCFRPAWMRRTLVSNEHKESTFTPSSLSGKTFEKHKKNGTLLEFFWLLLQSNNITKTSQVLGY